MHEYLHLYSLKWRGYKCQICISFSSLKAITFCWEPVRLPDYQWSLVAPIMFALVIGIPASVATFIVKPFLRYTITLSWWFCLLTSISDIWQLTQTYKIPPNTWVANSQEDTVIYETREAASKHLAAANNIRRNTP
ncbi:MAG: metalloprotease family protein [Moorellaceae bacterium]